MANHVTPVLPGVAGKDGLGLQLDQPYGSPAALARRGNRGAATVSDDDEMSEVHQAVDRLNQAIEVLQVNARFRILEDPRQIVVEMYDSNTGEVLREIPPRRLLEMYADMMRMVGLNLDRKA